MASEQYNGALGELRKAGLDVAKDGDGHGYAVLYDGQKVVSGLTPATLCIWTSGYIAARIHLHLALRDAGLLDKEGCK